MRKLFALLLVTIPFIHAQAQREYLPTPEDLTRFHTTKTYVVLSDNPLAEYNFEIQDAIKKYWNITEYEFLNHDDFGAKSVDKNASFLYVAAVNFEKDKSHTRYMFLCLSLGGDYETIDDMKDVANLPLSYHGVDEDRYAYKLGTMIRFLQDHVRLITDNPDMVSQNVYKHYNDNMADVRGKTIYLVEDELERGISSEAKIRQVYPYDVKIVEPEDIKQLIMAGDENAVFLHKVGPEGKKMNARVYKILIGAADGKFYYFDYHKVNAKNPDTFMESDFKKLARAVK
ncbi:MAG: hypothetical protein KAT15_09770 [Bacteroidales bacterium]|nr:hypothetical protein [Bacteroidales bacterium]